MKDYREMADSVFEKMDREIIRRKHRREKMIKIASGVSVFAVIVGVTLAFHRNSFEKTEHVARNKSFLVKNIIKEENKTEMGSSERNGVYEEGQVATMERINKGKSMAGDASTNDGGEIDGGELNKEGMDELRKGEIKAEKKTDKEELSKPREKSRNLKTFEKEQTRDYIVTNVGGDWIYKCNVPVLPVSLEKSDEVSFQKKELEDYFGCKIFPEVPEDLKEWEVPDYQVYKKNAGRGETYYDRQVLSYTDNNFKRTVNLEVETIMYEGTCGIPPKNENFEFSMISGNKVKIFKHKGEIFSANFQIDKVFFRLVTSGLGEDETVQIIKSLMED